MQVRFYTRDGCHLCKEALTVLQELQKEFKFQVQLINISSCPDLEATYGDDIPVAEIDGQKIFKHRANLSALRRILQGRICK